MGFGLLFWAYTVRGFVDLVFGLLSRIPNTTRVVATASATTTTTITRMKLTHEIGGTSITQPNG